jgi:XRE family transcriptional regulator, aerobic/anaerobic benzoate catabolism transcriptional regulator
MSEKDLSNGLLKEMGARVRALRVETRLTQTELAERATLSPRFVAQIEAGQANISILRLAEISFAFNRPLQELIPPPSDDGSFHAEIWRLLSRCREEDWQELLHWLRQRLDQAPAVFIALVGLRGSGKSTVGARLAKRLKIEFIELDSLIESAAGISLEEIFAIHGEHYYRGLEREVLRELSTTARGGVVATGGSVVTDPESWALLRRRCFTVWLHALPEEFMRRLQKQGDMRPMQGRPAALDELKALLGRREPLYSEAQLTVKTTGKSPGKVVKEIIEAMSA